jgi:glycine/D-amino acid oxidase-like deaminating enzyme
MDQQPVKEYPYWWDTTDSEPHRAPSTQHPAPGTEPAPGSTSSETVLPSRADVVIVGAGYTGLAAARQVARAGASVVVLERERVGWGASSRNGGQVLTGFKLDPATLVARFGESRARELFDASLESIAALEQLIADEAIECDYERTGHIQAASKPSHFDAFRVEQALLARVFEHRVDVMPAADQRAEIGTDAYFGVMVDRRSGALNPARYVDRLGASACRAGAAIVEHTRVTRVCRRGPRWIVTTGRGAVDAGELLVATNGYADEAVPWLRKRFVPIGSYIIATEPLTPADATALLPAGRTAFDSKHFLHYYRLSRDHRLLFGGRAQFTRATRETTQRSAQILRQDMVTIFPSLRSARVEYAWSGNVAFTRDQLPHAGRLEGAYYAGGYCGHGIAMATRLGELIARRMGGEPIDHPLFDDRFPPIPLYRGTPWFLPLAGAYYALKDWLE